MEKRDNVYLIENEAGLAFSVQKVTPTVTTSIGKEQQPDEVMFLVEHIKSKQDLTASNDLAICLDRAEVKELVKVLLDMI